MAKTSSTGAAATGSNIPASHVNNLATDAAELYSQVQMAFGYNMPFTPPAKAYVPLEVSCADGETIGATSSDGRLLLPGDQPAWSSTLQGGSTAVFSGSTSSSTANTVMLNKLFLAPPLAAAQTVTDIAGALRLVLTDNNNAGTAVIDSFDIILTKVTSGGTETAVDTYNYVPASTTAGGGASVIERKFYKTYGAGYAFAATDRIGIRIKVKGSNASSASITVYLNDNGTYYGGSYMMPDQVCTRPSIIALKFA